MLLHSYHVLGMGVRSIIVVGDANDDKVFKTNTGISVASKAGRDFCPLLENLTAGDVILLR